MPNRTTGVKSEEVISMASDDKNVSDSVDANSHSISSLSESSTASLIAAGAAAAPVSAAGGAVRSCKPKRHAVCWRMFLAA
jgi:hypothetical protein